MHIESIIGLVLLGGTIFRIIILSRNNKKHVRELAENQLQIKRLESDTTKAQFQQQATELEMQALRAQMNPHFIFNCLSSINHFILKTETETASDYLTKFSRLIRMLLNNSKHKYITLNEELDCLELYIQMEQLRFKNSFHYKIKCSSEVDAEEILIPPLLIQPFVENAIWNGLSYKEDQRGNLDVNLQKEQEILECTITDNGVGRKAALAFSNKSVAQHQSIALQITKERIALLDDEEGEHSLVIEDLYDTAGIARGTKVTLRIRYKTTVEKLYS